MCLLHRLPTYCVPLPGENSWLHGCSPNNINPGLSSPGLVCFGGECDSFEKKRVFSSTNSGNAAEESKGSVGKSAAFLKLLRCNCVFVTE